MRSILCVAILLLIYGDEGNRTPDLLNAIQTLSQLSYAPKNVQKSNGLLRNIHVNSKTA